MAALGCGERPAGTAERGHTYTVRGQVTQLPDPRSPGSGLYVSHEAVDNFVGRSGEVEGMNPMNMPFPVAEGVSLDGIAPRDVIEFDLHVDWQADRSVEITRIRELPPGTKLDFRLARPDKQDNEKKE
jgi:Copper binding periplasmic protein CusF